MLHLTLTGFVDLGVRMWSRFITKVRVTHGAHFKNGRIPIQYVIYECIKELENVDPIPQRKEGGIVDMSSRMCRRTT